MTHDDRTYCMVTAGLWLVLFCLCAPGCGNKTRVEVDPAIQKADEGSKASQGLFTDLQGWFRKVGIGDTGRDIDKSTTTRKTSTVTGERVTVSTLPTNVLIGAAVALALFLIFMAWTINRMLAYRHGLAVVQSAIEDEGGPELVEAIKPRVRAMGRGKKKLFDRLLERGRLG